jgi:hypothetical protein
VLIFELELAALDRTLERKFMGSHPRRENSRAGNIFAIFSQTGTGGPHAA